MRSTVKRFFSLILITLFLGVFCRSTAAEEREFDNKDLSSHRNLEEITQALNLTSEQKEAVRRNKETSSQKKRDLYSRMRILRSQLREELKRPGTTRADIEDTVTEIKHIQGSITDLRVDSFLEFKALLTPDQFTKMKELKEDMGMGRKSKKRYR